MLTDLSIAVFTVFIGWWGFLTCMAIEERADRRRDGIK